jgi:hypothetical protein
MGREVRRVPLGFNWPMGKVWEGFLTPEWLREASCPDCKNGYSRDAEHLFDLWYGYAPFQPEDSGSERLTEEAPAVRRRAERNVAGSPAFYGGGGEEAIVRECKRLAGLWNGRWMHHLRQQDVDALIAAGRLRDFTHTWIRESGWQPRDPRPQVTAREVNEWSLGGLAHDAINAGAVIRARCEAEGLDLLCDTCQGHGYLETFVGQRALAEAWQSIDPPTGEAWQVWETVSEGSPTTPAFETPGQLAHHLASPSLSYADALAWITGTGWAPSMIVTSTGLYSNVEAAVALGREAS